jgi:hypothetical protein
MGSVYAFATLSMPGLIKIGATRREVTESLAEANRSEWGPPEPFVVACYAQVEDPFAVKRSMRTVLAGLRVHQHRDFYRATTDEARALFAQLDRGPT